MNRRRLDGSRTDISANSLSAILEENARLGAGVGLDRETWFVRDGIVVIPKEAETQKKRRRDADRAGLGASGHGGIRTRDQAIEAVRPHDRADDHGLARDPGPNDDSVYLARVDVVVDRHLPIVVECIPQDIEHSLAGRSLGIVPQLEAECLAGLVVQPDDDFHVDEIGRGAIAGANVVDAQE
jgi:hypothetical protein